MRLGWAAQGGAGCGFRADAELFPTDFAQIELRILAHLSGDPGLLTLFQGPEGDDVFATLTAQW